MESIGPEYQPTLRRLKLGDPLLEPPGDVVPLMVDPQIQTLDFCALTWPDFQKLVVAIARDIDGHREAYEYGTFGQSQQGLDVFGKNDLGEVHAYQARNVQKFTASNLRKAVTDFASGERPWNPIRFVVVVACSANDTQVLEELANLRDNYSTGFSIDIYGAAELSEMLRTQSDIVERFFGLVTAERFCVGSIRQATYQPDRQVAKSVTQIADAVLRGPIEAMNLTSELRNADLLSKTNPADAAKEYQRIAERLSEGGWPGHELVMKRRAAGALTAAGEVRAAGFLLAQLFWTYVDLGADHESQMLRHELRKLAENTPNEPDLATWADTTGEGHDAVTDPLDRLDELGRVVDTLSSTDLFASSALLLLCELALASDQHELVVHRVDAIRVAVQGAPPASKYPSLGIRLRLCIADVMGDWSDLLSDARKHNLSPLDIALVLGRRGSYLASHNEPDLARDAFSEAINQGVLLKLYDDASQWIHATLVLDMRYGPISEQMNEATRRIQALRAMGSEQRLCRHLTSPRESALAHFHQEKYPAAADAARRYLRECVIAGHWGSEFEAHAFLGDLFAETGEPERAAPHFIRAVAQKKIESLFRNKPYIDVRLELSRIAPWERAVAYRAIVAEADLIPDQHVDEIMTAALADTRLVKNGKVRQSDSAPDLWGSAIAALASLVERASENLVGETLELLSTLVERDAGKYRFTDRDHMCALAGVIRGHKRHTQEAFRQIGRALEIGGTFSDEALRFVGALLDSDAAAVALLGQLSVQGNEHACLLLAARGIALSEVVEKAEEAFKRVIDRPSPKPGTVTFGTSLPQDATLISILSVEKRDAAARRLMQIAESPTESDRNRADALEGVFTLGGELSPEMRRELFSLGVRFATGEASVSDLSPDLREKPHPLSRFQVDLSPGVPLGVFGLKAAARLAQTQTELDVVTDLAFSMLTSADSATTHQIARMLSWLGGDQLVASQAVLAGQPDHSLRALAAVLWVRDVNRDPSIGKRLALDSNMLVRKTLASEIAVSGEDEPCNGVVAQLLADERYSVRSILRDFAKDR